MTTDGTAAFSVSNPETSKDEGLTKREHFAGQMLAAIIINEGAVGKWPDSDDGPARESIRRQDARRARRHADALIDALNGRHIDFESLVLLLREAVGWMTHLSKWDPGGSPENDAAEFEIRLRAALREAGVDATDA